MATQDVLNRLLGYAPPMYRDSSLWTSLMQGEAQDIGGVYSVLEDVGNQLKIDTATWGLGYYESELGLLPKSDDTLALRRSRVKAKSMGGATMTPSRLHEVLLTYVEDAKVRYDVANSFFEITILRPLGVPSLDTNLRGAVDELKPAHLGFAVLYTYLTWADMKTKTWAEAKTKTWAQFRSGQ